MKFIMLIVLIGYGNGGADSSNVPTMTKLEFDNENACEYSKKIILNDLENTGLLKGRRFLSKGLKESDDITYHDYSITCLPKSL